MQGKFLEGSIIKHILTMTGAGSVGLMAIFFVDLANLFYISLLGEDKLAAAIGYAATVLFFNNSASVGMGIAGSAIVARAIGAGEHDLARRRAGNSLLASLVVMTIIFMCIYPFMGDMVSLLGARGQTLDVAISFLNIVIPSFPVLCFSMTLAAILRANGEAKASMLVTMMGGLASAVLDPIFIFGLKLGVPGAAIASVLSRFVMAGIGLYFTVYKARLIERPNLKHLIEDWKVLFTIAIPAILTNVANPVGNAILTSAVARYGDSAVAGWSIVGRIAPLSFTALFALSGSVGPIFAQNLGGGKIDRLHETLNQSVRFVMVYMCLISLILFIAQDYLIAAFHSSGESAAIVHFFCTWIVPLNFFMGFLFVSNAAFNNLGHPLHSTAFNWGRATIGTVPLVYLWSHWGEAQGALAGQAIGSSLFGFLALMSCYRVIRHAYRPVPEDITDPDPDPLKVPLAKPATSPLSSAKANM